MRAFASQAAGSQQHPKEGLRENPTEAEPAVSASVNEESPRFSFL